MAKSIFKLEKSQRIELSKYWFDISKIAVGSLVIKLFEPGAPVWGLGSLLTFLSGLTFTLLFCILGLYFSKENQR